MTKSFTYRAAYYADSVLDGSIPACEHVKRACQRFIDDLERDDIYLSDDGEKWCEFLEKLPHVKGKWAAKKEKFVLSDWQIFATVNMYGWKRVSNDRRRFTEAYICVPRKNGKSFWVSGLGVGHITIDGEYGAEVYCGATTEKQAWEVFRPARQICQRTPALCSKFGVDIRAKSLYVELDGSRFEPVIGNPGDGASPACAIVDEFHEHKDSSMVDTFETGMGARENPMLLQITTAGEDVGGPCFAKQEEAINVLKGTVENDQLFALIYSIDEDDEWDTLEALQKANPNFGVSVDAEFLKAKMNQARQSAMKQNAFKTKHLNVWVGAKAAWMNMLAYQACRRADLDLGAETGRRCLLGIDLASKTDVACLSIVFPPDSTNSKYKVFLKHYLPETTIEQGNKNYQAWFNDGWITATPGNITDYSYIEDDLDILKSNYQIEVVAYDPFQATQFATRMLERGFPMVEIGQTVKNFSEPMKELEALIIDRRIEFEMDPVLNWMFGNVVAKVDKKDNIFPDKPNQEAKIDGVVATIMSLVLHIQEIGSGSSVYDERGILVL